jgi:hypothetical protein
MPSAVSESEPDRIRAVVLRLAWLVWTLRSRGSGYAAMESHSLALSQRPRHVPVPRPVAPPVGRGATLPRPSPQKAAVAGSPGPHHAVGAMCATGGPGESQAGLAPSLAKSLSSACAVSPASRHVSGHGDARVSPSPLCSPFAPPAARVAQNLGKRGEPCAERLVGPRCKSSSRVSTATVGARRAALPVIGGV